MRIFYKITQTSKNQFTKEFYFKLDIIDTIKSILNMKKIIIFILISLILCSCNLGKQELYKQTDFFVEQLQTTYSSYGLLGGMDDVRYTNDGYYKITPIGRLINVRIEEGVDDTEYEKLLNSLKRHYSNDNRVNDVYICGYGTIMIDCRN